MLCTQESLIFYRMTACSCGRKRTLRYFYNPLIVIIEPSLQAFFVTSPADLQHWVQTHPEYSREHLMLLAGSIADFKGLKKKDRQVLLDLIESSIM